MANSSNSIPFISPSQAGKDATANALFAAAWPAMGFGIDPAHTAGLTFGVLEGNQPVSSTPTLRAAQTVALSASTTNYIYLSSTGVVTKTTSAPTGWPGPITSPAGATALFTVITGASTITSYSDWRMGPLGPTGATGAAGATGATGATGAAGASGGSGILGIACVSHHETAVSGNGGGVLSTGAWTTRTLNTEEYDPSNIVTIASNKFTLGAGTYEVRWSSPSAGCLSFQSRLYNVTDSAVVAAGTGGKSQTSFQQQTSVGSAYFVIAGSKDYRIEMYVSSAGGVSGDGGAATPAGSDTQDIVFTMVNILKLA